MKLVLTEKRRENRALNFWSQTGLDKLTNFSTGGEKESIIIEAIFSSETALFALAANALQGIYLLGSWK